MVGLPTAPNGVLRATAFVQALLQQLCQLDKLVRQLFTIRAWKLVQVEPKKIQKDWNPESWNVSETLVSTLGGAATPVNECVPLSSIVIATKKKTTVKHPESRENQSFEINPN